MACPHDAGAQYEKHHGDRQPVRCRGQCIVMSAVLHVTELGISEVTTESPEVDVAKIY
jgi:hypothetical protein